MPSAQEISAERTPRAPRVRRRHQHFRFQVLGLSKAGGYSIRGATGCTLLLPTSFQRRLWSSKGTCVSYTFFFSLVVYGGDPIENELATLAANIRSFSRNGVEVLSNPGDRFWSALGDTHNPGRGGIPRKQSSVRVWPFGFSREAGRPAQGLKTEMFNVWRGLSTCTSQKWLRPASR